MKLIDADKIPWNVEMVGEIPVITKEEIDRLSAVDITLDMVNDYCRPRCLSVVGNELFERYKPVRHGQWISHPWAEIIEEHLIDKYECSECHHWQVNESNYCPECGAKMDGKKKYE